MNIMFALLATPLAVHTGPMDAENQRVEMHERAIAFGGVVPWHIHPGIEATYVLEGRLEMPRGEGATETVEAGQSFVIPRAQAHTATCIAESGCKVIVTYVVDADLPSVIPVEPPTTVGSGD